jgi:hypothetical protein
MFFFMRNSLGKDLFVIIRHPPARRSPVSPEIKDAFPAEGFANTRGEGSVLAATGGRGREEALRGIIGESMKR